MRAPAILVFLHHLSASITLWATSSYDLPTQQLQIDKLQLNMQGVKGAAVPAALGALQVCARVWLSFSGHVSTHSILTCVGHSCETVGLTSCSLAHGAEAACEHFCGCVSACDVPGPTVLVDSARV